jgi:hypothetical protein
VTDLRLYPPCSAGEITWEMDAATFAVLKFDSAGGVDDALDTL